MNVLIFLLLCMPYYHVMSQGSVSPVPTPTPTPASSPLTDSGECRFVNFSCPLGLTLTNRTFSQVDICAPILNPAVAGACRFVSMGPRQRGFICSNLYGLKRPILCIPMDSPNTTEYCFCPGLPEIRISGLPDIMFVGNASTLTEDDGVLNVCAVAGQLDEEFTPVNVTISTSTVKGTAKGGSDFASVNQTFSFQSGQTQCVNVSILRDSVTEVDESFTLELTLEYEPFDIALDTYNITIVDSDNIGIRFEREVYFIHENVGSFIVYVVTNVTLESTRTALAVLQTQDVSAKADADYHPVHQTLVFSDDSGDRIPVNITIIKDNEQNEFYEVFLLSLTSIDIPLLSPKAVIIILDQDLFYPFGAGAGDIVVPPGTPANTSDRLTLAPPFRFFSRNESTLYVNTNGALSFNRPFTEPEPESFPLDSHTLISPYWEHHSTSRFGRVYYRNTTDIALLRRAQYRLQDIFPSARNFFPSYLFIATWDGVPQLGTVRGDPNLRNTFQAVLATDGEKSFVFFIYMDIQWGTGGIGFNAGDGVKSFSLNESVTDAARMIEDDSNVGVVGEYAFRVDLQNIVSPGECGEQAGVIRLFSGSTTSEGEVQYCDDSMWTPVCGDTWGENEAAVACRQLGFAGEGAIVSLGELGDITPLTTNFSCMGMEINLSQCSSVAQPNASCLNLTRVTCNAVQIGFDQTSYTVAEGNESVTVCVNMTTGSASVPVSLETITIGSAQNETDYIATSAEFLFEGAPQQLCTLINITDDDRIEPTEQFLVVLNTTSQTVSLNPQFVFVTITDDDDSVRIGFDQTSYTVAEGDESVTVCVNMTTGIATVPVSLETIDTGSAEAGTDYNATREEFLFVGAPQQMCIQINITDDGVEEPRESFLVMLNTTQPSGFVSLNPQFISVIITDDDVVAVPLGTPAGVIAGSVFGGIAIGIILTLLAGGPLYVLWNSKTSSYASKKKDVGSNEHHTNPIALEELETESRSSKEKPPPESDEESAHL